MSAAEAKTRVEAEKAALDIKLADLNDALAEPGDIFGHRHLLQHQANYMRQYSGVLAKRLALFDLQEAED